MTNELPGGGTDQTSGASQAAAEVQAPASPAAPQAERLYRADTAEPQQASAGKEAASQAAAAGEEPQAVKGEQGEQPDAPKEQGAPGQYEFKPVEGVQFSDEVIGKFSEVARALNLSQDAAQKMLDQVAPAIARQQQAAVHSLSEKWASAVKADKEIGGEKLGEHLATARKARDAFGSNGLRALLNESRLGNHPEMVKFFVKVGQAISEDKFVPGGTRPLSGGKDAAAVLYGK